LAVAGNKPVPFTVTGTSSDPVFKPNYGAVAKEEIKSIEGDIGRGVSGLLNGVLGRKKRN
jgi:hypothetical protein